MRARCGISIVLVPTKEFSVGYLKYHTKYPTEMRIGNKILPLSKIQSKTNLPSPMLQ